MFSVASFTDILAPFIADELLLQVAHHSQGDGAALQRERLFKIAEYACQEFEGDLAEIGCLHGSTTVKLAEIAKKYNRKVIAVDPWTLGTQNCEGGEYDIFCQTIAPYALQIELLRMRSVDARVAERLQRTELAFAFVDGLHEYATCLHDITITQQAGIIAVDDTRELSEVLKAFDAASEMLPKTVYKHAALRESYFLPNTKESK